MEERIRESTTALADALARGDAAAAAALYDAEAALLASSSEPIRGRSGIEEYWHAGIGLGLAQVELLSTSVEVVGVVAIEIGRYLLGLDARDGAVADRGTYVVLHRCRPGGPWRRAVEVFNPDAPEPARPTPKEER